MMQGPSIVGARLFNLAHQAARLGKGYANTMGRYCRQPPYTTNTHGTLGGAVDAPGWINAQENTR